MINNNYDKIIKKIIIKLMDEDNDAKKSEKERLKKLNEINNEELKIKEQASGTYGIDIIQIEELMSSYKERGPTFRDIQKLKELGGPEGIMQKLKTHPKKGILSSENRENDFGSNKLFIEPVPPFCSYVKEALEDLMIRILIVAAVVQIILGALFGEDPSKDWIDGFSIIAAVIVVTLVGSITNYNKETKFHELNTIQNKGTTYKIIREGIPTDIISDDILVGDLINIMVGDILPADLLLIEGNGLRLDESSLTGESEPLKKENYNKCREIIENNSSSKVPSPLMLSGSNCLQGSGYAIVLAVGDHSQKGIIKRTVDNAQENNKTPLEEKLDVIVDYIGWFGMGAGITTLVALTLRFIISFFTNEKKFEKDAAIKDILYSIISNYNSIDRKIMDKAKINLTDPKSEIAENILNIIMFCVSIIVVAIPEGLPLAVTLSLAFSIKKLMDQNNLVRKMHACETMGGANYICTDKTGTLTRNEMNIYRILTIEKEITLSETLDNNDNKFNIKNNKNIIDYKIRESHQQYFPNENYWDQLKLSIALNVSGQIREYEGKDINGDMEYCETKNKTDKAFIDFLYRFRVSISSERDKYMSDNKYFKQIPFDSKLKRMTSFVCNEIFPTGYRLFSKGAAEQAKTVCRNYLDPKTGEIKPIGDQERKFISEKIIKFNKQMLRSLYVCYKDITQEEYENCEVYRNSEGLSIDQYGCVFIACVGLRDSLRNGVKESVIKCHSAGVNVIMVTGDNIITATAIAKDCNILGDDINLENLNPGDVEEEPELTDSPIRGEEHIREILLNKPQAITGNTFYVAIGGLICSSCNLETNMCKCPKTQAEAEKIEKTKKIKDIKIKCDTIKNKKNFIEIIKNLKVMARSQPIHKYALVLGLKELNQIVAVTGDGTNDAPALSKSDVGFAMFSGTDIAKESSDIIIINNNFSSLLIAIIYGRNIYDNIRKFLQFQLTVNFCACLLVFICACIGNETPLTTIQMLWINLIMDSLGSLALATEPPYEELLNRSPTKKDESIINGKMWKHIIIQSCFQLILLIFLYLCAPYFIKENDYVRLVENEIISFCFGKMPGGSPKENIIFGISPKWSKEVILRQSGKNSEFLCGTYSEKIDLSLAYHEYHKVNANSTHMTIVFNVFVIYTLFNQINCRVIDDNFNIFIRIRKNNLFPIMTLSELILQIIIVELGGDVFKCTERGLTHTQWLICIGFSLLTFILSFIIKLIPINNWIQNILDNKSKSNKVANMNDLISEDNEAVNSRIISQPNNCVVYQKSTDGNLVKNGQRN